METTYNFIAVFILGSFSGVLLQSWILRKADRVQREDTRNYFEILRKQIDKLLTINSNLSNKVVAKDISAYAGLMDLDKSQGPAPTNLKRSDEIEAMIEEARMGSLNE